MLKASLVDQLDHILKERIMNLELKLGQKMDTQKIANEFGISQTPVRDVLNRLVQEGLVRLVPRVGYYMVNLSSEDLTEIYDLRKMFECHVLKSAINGINKDELKEIKQRSEEVQGETDRKRKKAKFDEIDLKLHSLIISSARNKRLKDLFLQIYNFVRISLWLGLDLDRALKEHIELINAILEKNVSKSIQLLGKHIDNSLKEARQLLERYAIDKNKIFTADEVQSEKYCAERRPR